MMKMMMMYEDECWLMVMWRNDYYYIDGMKKRKAGSANSTKTIIIVKKIEQSAQLIQPAEGSQLLFDFSLPTLWKFFIIEFPRNQKKKYTDKTRIFFNPILI